MRPRRPRSRGCAEIDYILAGQQNSISQLLPFSGSHRTFSVGPLQAKDCWQTPSRRIVSMRTRVLIVGGGPVGLTLAMDLAWRGIDVIVAERRPADDPPSVKCGQISARSMEVFRRLGVADKLREVGLPPDYANDIVSTTSVLGIELSRVLI